jgi:hypothetical protein
VGSENLNPLDELKTLDQQVEKVTELAGLKPVFFRLDEIAKQHPNDFEVQLVVGDIKQHLVNRGTRIKETQQKAQEAPPVPAAASPPPLPSAAASPSPPSMPPPVPQGPPPVPSVPSAMPPPQPADAKSPKTLIPPTMPPKPKVTPPAQAPPSPLTSAVMPPPSSTSPQVPPLSRSPLSSETPARKAGPPAIPPTRQGPLATAETPSARKTPTGATAQRPGFSGVPVPPPQGPNPPLNWKRALLLGGLAGSVVSIALIAFLVNQARKRNLNNQVAASAVQVQITTTPPGASVRINGETKCTSDCSIPLNPGDYQVTAFLDGYEPAASGVSVAQAQPASVNLTLEPQAQSMRILTDLDQGKVALDDQPAADLQEGQFVLDKVAPGSHTVKLTGRNNNASFTFEITPGKPPAVTGPVAVRNLIAVLVTSFGGQARAVTNSGPMKLAVNGQPQGDVGPAGLDLRNFQPGVDELVVGEGKDQRNMKESFGPAPMLTAFFKSDLNIGTLIVSTGEDDARVFLNNKEYRLRTKRGEVRIQTIGNVTVAVAKDGFQNEPVQMAEVKKGAEVRLEFKLKPLPQASMLQIRGATPGAEVLIDQKGSGTIGPDGNFAYNGIAPGDHNIELRREQFTPRRFQRTFRAGQTVEVSGADVVLAAIPVAPSPATVKVVRTPAEATVTYRRNEETQTRDLRGNQVELPPGTYVFNGAAPGYIDHAVRFSVAAGETRNIEITLQRERQPTVTTKTGDMTDFEDPGAWRKEGDLWVHKGAGFIPYKMPPKGVFTFTVTLVQGGGLFRGGRIRWALQYADSKNYDLFELDKKNFWSKVVAKGRTLERARAQHDLEKEKSYTVEIEVSPDHVVHKIRSGTNWITLDTWAESGRDFSDGKFGFLIQGNDEIGVSDFKFEPK